jgi:drug/metabolite transporter (DMT)-like permease
MQAPKREIFLMGCLYMLFSSTMMICNKAALKVFPFPLQLTAFQYLISAAAVCVLASLSVLEAEGLKKEKVQQFWLVSAVFTLAIFSNTRVLHVASVETVIVFRTTVALLTSVGDWVWLNKELPSTQSWVALLTIVGGAAGYMISEGGSLTSDSIAWGSIYVLVLAFEVIFHFWCCMALPVRSTAIVLIR